MLADQISFICSKVSFIAEEKQKLIKIDPVSNNIFLMCLTSGVEDQGQLESIQRTGVFIDKKFKVSKYKPLIEQNRSEMKKKGKIHSVILLIQVYI